VNFYDWPVPKLAFFAGTLSGNAGIYHAIRAMNESVHLQDNPREFFIAIINHLKLHVRPFQFEVCIHETERLLQ
jgi:hypothetical protein